MQIKLAANQTKLNWELVKWNILEKNIQIKNGKKR